MQINDIKMFTYARADFFILFFGGGGSKKEGMKHKLIAFNYN